MNIFFAFEHSDKINRNLAITNFNINGEDEFCASNLIQLKTLLIFLSISETLSNLSNGLMMDRFAHNKFLNLNLFAVARSFLLQKGNSSPFPQKEITLLLCFNRPSLLTFMSFLKKDE
jgi:hypothetical protein